MRFEKQICKGIDYLFSAQTEEGNFPDGLFIIEKNTWIDTKATVFSTSLIAHSVCEIIKLKNLLTEEAYNKCLVIQKKLVSFFIKEMKMPGLWKFGISSDNNWNKLPYDIDDTCCVSYLLRNQHPYILFGMNRNLILKNRNEEGLFYTWFIPKQDPEKNPIDSVVNINALLYLGENEITEPVVNYICDLIKNNKEPGSFYYYIDPLCFYFIASRAFAAGVSGLGNCAGLIKEKIINREAETGSILFTAASITSLLNFNITDNFNFSEKIKSILDTQKENGSWQKYPFYQGEEYPKPIGVYFGSECISTALCLEAVLKYQSVL